MLVSIILLYPPSMVDLFFLLVALAVVFDDPLLILAQTGPSSPRLHLDEICHKACSPVWPVALVLRSRITIIADVPS